MNVVSRAVRAALLDSPSSLREVGRRAGVSHAQLARIVSGERPATPLIAEKVATALKEIAAESLQSAARIRRSLTKQRGKKG